MSDNKKISIRSAMRTDAGTIFTFLNELAAHDGHQQDFRMTTEDVIRFGFEQPRRFEILIAEMNGRPVGMGLYFWTFSTWNAGPTLFLNDLYVRDDCRGFGVGKRLLSVLALIARRQGSTRVEWQVVKGADAVNFYQALGAIEIQALTNYRLDGDALSRLVEQTDNEDTNCT